MVVELKPCGDYDHPNERHWECNECHTALDNGKFPPATKPINTLLIQHDEWNTTKYFKFCPICGKPLYGEKKLEQFVKEAAKRP